MSKCRYCLKPLDEKGFCSRPCTPGSLLKRKAELEEKLNKYKTKTDTTDKNY